MKRKKTFQQVNSKELKQQSPITLSSRTSQFRDRDHGLHERRVRTR